MTKQPIPIDEVSKYPSIPLARFNKTANLAIKRILAAHSTHITREQEVILRHLCRQDGINQVELAARVGQERNNLSRTLTILEDKNYIERKVCRQDKRNSLVFVTETGRQVHAEAYNAMQIYRSVLFMGFTPDEIEQFAATIHELIANLEEYTENGDVEGD